MFANLKIRSKIIAAFAAVVSVIVISGAVTVTEVADVRSVDAQKSREGETLNLIDSLHNRAVSQMFEIRGLLITGDPAYADAYASRYAEYEEILEQLKKAAAESAIAKDVVSGVSEMMRRWQTDYAEVQLALMQHPNTVDQARALEVTGESQKILAEISGVIDRAREQQAAIAQEAKAQLAASYDLTTNLAIGGAAVALLFAVLFGLILSRGIASPIQGMTEAMGRLADGDADVEIPGTGRADEVGAMSAAVAVFRDNKLEADRLAAQEADAQRLERERNARLASMAENFDTAVRTALNTVNQAANDLEASSDSLTAAVEETNGQCATASSSAEQASSNVQTVATAAEELSASIGEIDRQVSHSTQITRSAVELAADVDGQARDLKDAAAQVDQVLGLISEIADQTNLLALNATIEAARAGEAGKGFAVVASEVKGLAQQTGKATEEISGHVGGIQDAISTTVEAIFKIRQTIEQVDEISTAIAGAVREQQAATSEIARNVEQMASAASMVSTNISEVNETTGKTGKTSTNVLNSSRELKGQCSELDTLVQDFLTGVKTG